MATISRLTFSIHSTYSGTGTTAAIRSLAATGAAAAVMGQSVSASTVAIHGATTAAIALAPALVPIAAAATSVTAATVAMGVGAGSALGIYGVAMAGAIKRTMDMAESGKKLDPVQKSFVGNVGQMSQSWNQFIASTSNQTLSVANDVVVGLTAGIGRLKPVVDAVHPSIKRVSEALRNWLQGEGLQRFINTVIQHGVPAMNSLINAGRDVLATLGIGFRTFAPEGVKVAAVLERGAAALRRWAEGGGFQRFLAYAREHMPRVRELLSLMGQALSNVGTAMAGLGPLSLLTATSLLRIVAALPPSWIQAIVVGFVAWRVATLGLMILGALANLVLALSRAITIARAAWLLLSSSFLFSPLGLVVIAITALVGGIVYLATQTRFFQTVWDAVWNGVKLVAEWIWNFLTSKWGWLIAIIGPVGWIIAIATHWSQVWNGIKLVADVIWNALVATWTTIVNAFTLVWNAVSGALAGAWNAVWNGLSTAAQFIWNALRVAWQTFINALALVWSAVSGALTAAWNAVWNGLSTAAQFVWNALRVAWQTFINGLALVWSAVSGALRTAWNAVWNALSTAAQAVWNALRAAWQTFIGTLTNAWNVFSGALRTSWNLLWTAIRTAAEAVWNALKAAWQVFANTLRSIYNTMAGAIRTSWNLFWNAVKTIAETIWNALKAAWQAFANTLRSIYNTMAGAIRNSWNLFWNAVKTIAETIWNALKAAWQTFANTMRSIYNTMAGAIRNSWNLFWNTIKNVAQTIWNTIKEAWDKFLGGVRKAADTFISGVKKAFSDCWNAIKDTANKVWHQIGEIIEKAINGVIGIINALINAFNNITGFLKLDLKIGNIPTVDFNFATGGVVPGMRANLASGGTVPGYSPGRDKVPAMLSPGEGVLTPEAVRGLGGPGFVHSANRAFSGHRGAGRGAGPLSRYTGHHDIGYQGHGLRMATGGVVPGAQHFAMGGITLAALARAGLAGTPITQPEYNPGVAASAGTHDGGGVIDLPPNVDVLMKLLATGEWAAWMRTPAQGFAPHIHAVLMSHPDLAPIARAQVASFLAGGTGLGVGGGGGGGGPNPFTALKDKLGDILRNVALGKDPMDGIGGSGGGFLGGLFGNILNTLTGGLTGLFGGKGLGGMLLGMVKGPMLDTAFKHIADMLGKALPGGGMGEIAIGIGKKLLEAAKNFILGEAEKATDYSEMGAGNVAAWAPLASEALARAGIGKDQLDAFLALMRQESGGDPMAINMWDSNAKMGQASRGLMQVIPSTFAAYRDPSLPDNILDPLANMTAAARYIKARYGGKVPGSPYFGGTNNARRGWHLVGENGPEWRYFRGGEQVMNARATQRQLQRIGGDGGVVFEKGAFQIDARGASVEAVREMETNLIPKLRLAVQAGVGRRG